jgi:hypothetical protein
MRFLSGMSLMETNVVRNETEESIVRTPVTAPERKLTEQEKSQIRARRTAFVARFIVLREGKRTRAHRIIEMMEWKDLTTMEDLAATFRKVFEDNGDKLSPVDRDLKRSIAHASRALNFFIQEYSARSTTSFVDALFDYERSNKLLFGNDEDQPRPGGWRLPQELLKAQLSEEEEKEAE